MQYTGLDRNGKAVRETTLYQAHTLSSGTIASLSDENDYDIIDRVRYWFILFVERSIRDNSFSPTIPWQTAWKIYTGGVEIV